MPKPATSSELADYAAVHHSRPNLLVHAVFVPVFMAGTLAIPLAVVVGPWWLALVGLGTMAVAIGFQGITHAREPVQPAPFRGPVDVVASLLVEQWITWPRYVAGGGFARAWRDGGAGSTREDPCRSIS